MPGHLLNHGRDRCTVCGLTSLEIARSGTMTCAGQRPPTTDQPVAVIDADAFRRQRLTDPPRESEDEFQASVIDLADLYGWRVYHTQDSRKSRKGYPDLTMVHPRAGRLIFAELKAEDGKVTPDQKLWLDDLAAVRARHDRGHGPLPFEVYLWRPGDWDKIVTTLEV